MELIANRSSTLVTANKLEAHLARHARGWSVLILLLMFSLALTSMVQKAPTFDEQGFILRGLAYLRGYRQIRVGHPLGLNALNAILLLDDSNVALPLDDPSWSGTSFHRPAELFLWEIGNDVRHVMFLARLPSIWLGMLLAAVAGRWAWHISGHRWPGILALLFVALDPNILAHTRLATTDLGLTAFSLLGGYTLWRFLKKPTWMRAIVAGIAMGLLQNTKFTAGLFVPLFALVILIGWVQMWRDQIRDKAANDSLFSVIPWRPLLLLLLLYPLAAILTLWTAYGFDIGVMPADLPMLSALSGKTLPLSHHLEQLLDIGGRLSVGTPSFLLGQYSDGGWWYYFPVAFLLKTPLPTLILVGWGTGALVYCIIRYHRQEACLSALDISALLVPALGYFTIALTTDINLGYRHILPVLPYLIVFAAATISKLRFEKDSNRSIIPATLLSFWLVIITLMIYPHFLSYFNLLAGGAQKGWHSLVDSNLDWGQDLDDLPGWMADNSVNEVWLSYFGEAHPEYYGIAYRGLDSFPPRLMNPQARPFFPADPAPGIYAISATNLQGVHFTYHEQFAWFREQNPIDSLGNSIYLYQVEPYGEAVSLLLSGVQIDEVLPDDFALLGSNDVNPRWIDLSQSLIIPRDLNTWLLSDSNGTTRAELVPYLEGAVGVDVASGEYVLARYEAPELPEDVLAEFSLDDGRILLHDVATTIDDNGKLTVVTVWEQFGAPRPLKFFVHLTEPGGNIISQWDGLGVEWEGLQEGDRLIQVHDLPLATDALPEEYVLFAGVYDPQTGRRWATENGLDAVELGLSEQP